MFLLSTPSFAAASPDKITFNNGDISSGILLGVSADQIAFAGQLTGKLNYKWQDIKTIEISSGSGRQALLSKNLDSRLMAKIVQPSPIHSDISDSAAKVSQAAPASVATSSAANIVPRWGGQISTQDLVTRATQDQYQLGGNLHMSYETAGQEAWQHQIVSLDSTASFSEAHKPSSPTVKLALFQGTLMYNVYLVSSELRSNFPNSYNSYFLWTFADGYHNLSLGIDAQQSYGVGVGWLRTVRGQPNQNGDQLIQVFGIQGDFRYSNQQLYAPGVEANLAGAGIKESYSIAIPGFGPKSKELSLSESITVIPYFNDSRALQVRGTAQFALPLTQRLSVGPKLVDDYFRNAPRTSKQNYLQPSLNLTYNFGPLSSQ